jgi:hypothetical protein
MDVVVNRLCISIHCTAMCIPRYGPFAPTVLHCTTVACWETSIHYIWSPSQEFLTNIDAVRQPPSYIMIVHRNLRYFSSGAENLSTAGTGSYY